MTTPATPDPIVRKNQRQYLRSKIEEINIYKSNHLKIKWVLISGALVSAASLITGYTIALRIQGFWGDFIVFILPILYFVYYFYRIFGSIKDMKKLDDIVTELDGDISKYKYTELKSNDYDSLISDSQERAAIRGIWINLLGFQPVLLVLGLVILNILPVGMLVGDKDIQLNPFVRSIVIFVGVAVLALNIWSSASKTRESRIIEALKEIKLIYDK